MSKIYHNSLEDVTINILYTFSMSGEVEEFRSRIPNRLQGPGVFFLSNDRAYFQKFLINTTVGFTVVVVVLQSWLYMCHKSLMFTHQKIIWPKYIIDKTCTEFYGDTLDLDPHDSGLKYIIDNISIGSPTGLTQNGLKWVANSSMGTHTG